MMMGSALHHDDTTTAVYYWYTRTDDGIREVIYINKYMYMYDILM